MGYGKVVFRLRAQKLQYLENGAIAPQEVSRDVLPIKSHTGRPTRYRFVPKFMTLNNL